MKKFESCTLKATVNFTAVSKEMERLANIPYDDLRLAYAEQIRSPKPALHPKVMIFALGYKMQAAEYEKLQKPMPERVKTRMNVALNATCFEDLVKGDVILSQKEKHMAGVIISECPGFRTAWDETQQHCQDCRLVFPDEYAACKSTCTSAERRQQVKEQKAIAPPADAAVAAPVVTGLPFREGSRAGLMFKYISGTGRTTVTDVAKYLFDTIKLSIPDGKAAVISYVDEWQHGAWGGKPRNWDWQVVMTKEGQIAFSKKEASNAQSQPSNL